MDSSLVDRQTTAVEQRRFTARLLDIALIAVFLLPVLIYAYGGTFTRYIADDYCAAGAVNSYGFLGSIDYWYQAWSGRYTEWVFKGITTQIGIGVTMLLPAIVMALIFAALVWTLQIFTRLLRLHRPLFAALLGASILTYAIVDTAPNLFQSFYWHGALIPYTLPLALLIFYLGFIVRTLSRYDGKLPVTAIIASFVMTFIGGGLSEVYVAFQTAALLLAALVVMVAAPARLKRPGFILLGIGLAGSLLAFAVIAAAPGNAVRASNFPSDRDLFQIVSMSLSITLSLFVSAFVYHSPFAVFTLFVSATVIGYQFHDKTAPFISQRKVRLLLGAILLFGLGMIFSGIVPAVYAMSLQPPLRHYILAKFALLCIVALWGYLMGAGVKKQQGKRLRLSPLAKGVFLLIGAALFIVGPIASSARAASTIPQLATYAAAWDAQDSAIRAAAAQGESNVVVNALPVDLGEMAALDVLGENPDTGFNRCAAQYYGIDSLVVRHDS